MPSQRRAIVRRSAPILAIAWLVAACLLAAPAAAERPLEIAGSDTMVPLVHAWLSGAAVEGADVEGRGSATGPPALLGGRADLVAMTRELSEVEEEAFRRRFGHLPVAFWVASDVLWVAVNADNPIDEIDRAQLDGLFGRDLRCGGKESLSVWSQLGVGGEWEGRAISVYGRGVRSGTHAYFRSAALCGGAFREGVRHRPGGSSVAHSIAEDRFAIGYLSSTTRAPGIKPLRVDSGDGAVEPGATGGYAFARPLFLMVNPSAPNGLRDDARRVIEFALSDEGQAAVADLGFTPLLEGNRERERSRIP